MGDRKMTALEQKLLAMDASKFKNFDLDGVRTIAKVLRIYDTDTMTIGFKHSSRFYRVDVRCKDIDAPELHSKVPEEAKLCRLGREYLKCKYLGQLIEVEMGPMDKYGRVLATIVEKGATRSINQQLVSYKFARPYGGDLHKTEWAHSDLQEGIDIAGGLGIKDSVREDRT